MLSIESVVMVVLYLLGVGIIFGLLLWLINYVALQLPTIAPWAGLARIFLAAAAVLVLIGLILSFMGHPLVH